SYKYNASGQIVLEGGRGGQLKRQGAPGFRRRGLEAFSPSSFEAVKRLPGFSNQKASTTVERAPQPFSTHTQARKNAQQWHGQSSRSRQTETGRTCTRDATNLCTPED
ncbi:unnamed protein product, partial [Ectocarpus sp. 8 AP-2014]